MKRFQNYIRDVIAELRKVTWPTREELKGSTITVIIFSLMSTVFVFLVDFVLGKLVQLVLG
jgi:preprotein translocase subunit SecE